MNPLRIYSGLVLFFSCLFVQAQTVQVVSPNGGEVFPAGSQSLIQWNQTGLSNVQIDYSTNNGSSWLSVINSYPAVVGEFSWTVPSTLTTQALIRIRDLVNPLIADVSNQSFQIQDIHPAKYRGGSRDGAAWDLNITNAITLTSFNTGGSFPPNTQQFISWSANISEFVDVDWSSDNGSSWNSLGTNLPASGGPLPWVVPAQIGLTNFIRVRDSYSPGLYFTQSALPFGIIDSDTTKFLGGDYDGHGQDMNAANEIVLVYPQGGEFFPESSVLTLNWAANSASNVVLEYSSNNGASWQSITTPLPGNVTSFNWTLPTLTSAQMLVRVSDAANSNVSFDVSGAFSLIQQNLNKHKGGSFDGSVVNENQPNSVQLTALNGGEILPPGLGFPITWTFVNVADLTLEYSTNSGSSWVQIATGIPAVTGSYIWTVPQVQANLTALVRIMETGSPLVSDTSSAPFTILQENNGKHAGGAYDGHVLSTDVANALQLLSPIGGEQFAENSTQFIRWNANNIDFVRIEYSTNNGTSWNLITASYPSNLGSYSWVLPPTPTTAARVRVLDLVNQQTVISQSPAAFSIVVNEAVKFLGGSFDGNALSVNQPPSITVTSPSGGEQWFEGQVIPITWNSVNITDVDIEISTDNGTTWSTLANGEPAVLGQYFWTVNGYSGENSVRIRVASDSDPLINGVSTAPHTIRYYLGQKHNGGDLDGAAQDINLANAIQVVYPDGGEIFARSSAQQIRWNANNVPNVRIEYSTNNGSSWVLITANYQGNLGFYDWNIPLVTTSAARIRVSDILNQNTIFDLSDASFGIYEPMADKHFGGNGDGYSMNVNQSPSISLISPNGGETFYEGQLMNISWNSVNVSDISLEISSDNGSNWTVISASEQAVTSSYLWPVSGNYSAGQALVRLVDNSNSLVRDSSSTGFTIPFQVTEKNQGGDYDGHIKSINEDRALQVVSPNGGESFAQSSVQLIQWNANDITNVRLEFSSNNGSSWNLISANEQGNLVGYSWQIPQVVSSAMLIRVLDVLNPSTIRDTSNAPFSVQDVNPAKYRGGMGDGYSMNVNQPPSITVTNPNTALTWYEGQQVTISWSSVNVADVSIEISSNNGSSWTVLDSSEAAVLGSMNWLVTGFSSNASALIRVRDNSNPLIQDVSDVAFTIPHYVTQKNAGGDFDGFSLDVNQANALNLINPLGGQVFAENSNQQILWNANNISNVRLEYSTNNGSNWLLISANEVANLGYYNWVVPATPTLNARVKISDVLNPSSVFDISPTSFLIQSPEAGKYVGGNYDGHAMNVNQNPAVTVLTPNTGSEVFYNGQVMPITWTSVNISSLMIEVSSDNGSSWTVISPSEQAVSGSYNWTVSGIGGVNSVLVRLSDAGNPAVNDVSNNAFTVPPQVADKYEGGEADGFASDINLANIITLLTPNGGESYPEFSVQNVSWIANGVNTIRLEYSTNNGSAWQLVNSNINGNLGTFSWTVPSTPSAQVLFRALDVLNPLTYQDASNAVFSITSPVVGKYAGGSYDGFSSGNNSGGLITVTQPNGGEIWNGAATQTISWTSQNVLNLDIEYSSDNGSTWQSIVTGIPAQNQSYSWTIPPSVGGPQFLIRLDDSSNALVNDVSNAVFTVNLLYPEKYAGGGFDGFARQEIPGGTLGLTAPNTALTLQPNTPVSITWSQSIPGDVGLAYSTDNGSNWMTIIASVPGNSTPYTWVVPNTPTTQGLVRVYSVNVPTLLDDSDVPFSITLLSEEKFRGGSFDGFSSGTNLTPAITLTAPNGGELLIAGSNTEITWTQTALAGVGIEWSSDNGSSWTTIISNVSAQSGTFTWQVPGQVTMQALVRVFDAYNPALQDVSNAVFQIPFETSGKYAGGSYRGDMMSPATASNLVLQYPDLFENFAAGATVSVQWLSNTVAQVNLDYSTNNGSSWVNIATGVTAGLNNYSWTVPAVQTLTGLIRVSDLNNPGTVFDVSSVAFTINNPIAQKHRGGSFDGTAMDVNQPPAVTLTSPNGGEIWFAGGTYSITWTSVSVLNIDLEYSLNNGSTWQTIVSSIPTVLSSYNWTIPSTGSVQALVRVKDASNSLVNDVSDAVFVIPSEAGGKFAGGSADGHSLDLNAANTLVLVSPNGGEALAGSANVSIQWVANNLSSLMLEYSVNNGSSWQAIVVGTPANVGLYNWVVPSVNTATALVRLTDLVNPGQYWDVSDQVFSISAPIADKYFGGSYDGHSVTVNQVPSLTVLSPNGGELVYPGSSLSINWTSVNVVDVDIEYSTNNGSSWTVITTQEPAPSGTYLWNVPYGIAGPSLIRITDFGNNLMRDTSNAIFTLLNEVTDKYAGGNGDGAVMDIPLSSALVLLAPNGGESVAAGSAFSIQWISNGHQNVILEYSTNNGTGWTAITVNAPANTGVFNWNVPILNTSQALVRVSDLVNPGLFSDASNSTFRILNPIVEKHRGGAYDGYGMAVNQPPAITLSTPNGGEIFLPGNQHLITWSSVNVLNVDLAYSTNNGSSWTTISTQEPAALGQYLWLVPALASNQVLVRVRDSNIPAVSDVSDAPFSVPNESIGKYAGGSADGFALGVNAANSLQLLAPNGGESLAENQQFTIQWIANNLIDVILEYSSNNGSTWQAIVPAVAANSGLYQWQVPGVSTQQALVRVSDLVDPGTYQDASNAVFTINTPSIAKYRGDGYDGHGFAENQPPSITVIRPNGGENIVPGFQYEINWSSVNVSQAKIEFTSNNGSSWVLIDAPVPATSGSYIWTIPSLNSGQALVRVSDFLNPAIADTSNAFFTIPNFTDGKYRGGNGDGGVMNINAANALFVLTPNGGESFADGVNVSVAFIANALDNVMIEYSTNNGSSWVLASGNTPGNIGVFNWITPAVNTNLGRIRVSDLVNPQLYFDGSDNPFSINSPNPVKYLGGGFDGHVMAQNQPPSVTLIQPNGGQILYPGSSTNIDWTSINLTNVNLYYSTDSGSSWNVIDTQVPAVQGTYGWTIPPVFGNNMLVKVEDESNPALWDVSNAVFTVPMETPVKFTGGAGSGHDMDINLNRILVVVSPNGGEAFATGSTQLIQWAANTVTSVNIEWSANQGSTWSTVAQNIPANTGSYSWPVGLTPSAGNLIRISDAVFTNTRRDTSDQVFALYGPDNAKYAGGGFDGHALSTNLAPSLTLLTPNGGETWNSQTQQIITWNQVNVSLVNLEYSVNNGSSWTVIQTNAPGSAGQFAWLVPNNGSNTSLVRILDADNSGAADTSDVVFDIPSLTDLKYAGGGFDGNDVEENIPPVLTLTSPNGGEFWYAGSVQQIQWTVTNIQTVSLDYSTDNGSSWNVITSATPAAQGNFSWTVPNVAGNQMMVRVTDIGSGVLNDISDAVFEIPLFLAQKYRGGSYDGHGSAINPANAIVLIEPRGGEMYPVMTPQNILWAANSINAVNIEYSDDNGSTWFSLATAVSGQVVQYGWTAPGPATTQGLVRISQTGNLPVQAVSSSNFSTVDGIASKHFGGSYDGFGSASNAGSAITLLTPNGGETWYEGGTQLITWQQTDVTLLNLDVSTDNGTTWTNIVSNLPGPVGSYSWPVTGPGTAQALVRAVNALDAQVRDSSNAVFMVPLQENIKYSGGGLDGFASDANIPPSLTLTSPNGGEMIYPGSYFPVTWTSSNVSTIGLEYSSDNGSTWSGITSGISAQTGVYVWTTPSQGTSNGLIRIFSDQNNAIRDTSNATFSLLHQVDQKFAGGGFDGAVMAVNITTATLNGRDTVCAGNPVTLAFQLTGAAPWSVTFTDGTTPQTITGITISPYQHIVTPGATATYTIQSVSGSSGSGVGIGNFATLVRPLPSANYSASQTICVGSGTQLSVSLTGTAPWNITWTEGTTPTSVSGITASPYILPVTPSATRTYAFTQVQDLYCLNAQVPSTSIVQVEAIPTAIASGNSTICIGSATQFSIALTGSSPWDVSWTDGTTLAAQSGITATPYVVTLSPTSHVTYFPAFVSNAFCAGTVSGSADIRVEAIPQATLTGNQSICLGCTASLSLSLSGAQPWDVTWTDGTNQNTLTGITASPYVFTTTPAADVTYSLVSLVSPYCGGTVSGTAEVTVIPFPTATISGSQTVCLGNTAQVSLNLTGLSPWDVVYSDGTGQVTLTGITSSPYVLTFTPSQSQTYTLVSIADVNQTPGTTSGQATLSLFIPAAVPVALTPGSVNCTDITALWLSAQNATAYRFDLALDAGFSSFVSGYNDLPLTDTFLYIPGLNVSTQYYYRIRAIGGCGATLNSNVISLTTQPNTWIGTNSNGPNDWNDASNWCAGVPTSTGSALVPSGPSNMPSIAANTVVGELTIQSGAVVSLSGQPVLSVRRNWYNSGRFIPDTGTIQFTGIVPQLITGTDTFFHFRVDNTAGVTVASGSGNRQVIFGVYTPVAGNLVTNGNLVLGSTAQYTGRLAKEIAPTANTIGDIVFQRYFAQTGWHYIGIPTTNAHSGQLTGQVNVGSLYWYNEPTFGPRNTGLLQLGVDSMPVEYGYYLQTSTVGEKISVSGPPQEGTVNFPISWTVDPNNRSASGWNLISNPYPCTIDWSAPSGWNATGVSTTMFIMNPVNNTEASFNKATGLGTNGGTRYIASGQGIMIKATALNPTLIVTEDVKTPLPAPFFRNNQKPNLLGMKLRDDRREYESLIYFESGRRGAGDEMEDSELPPSMVLEPHLKAGTYGTDGTPLAINALPEIGEGDTFRIPVLMEHTGDGQYQWAFENGSTFEPGIRIDLEDRFTGLKTNVLRFPVYDWAIDMRNPKTFHERFQLVAYREPAGSLMEDSGFEWVVYPNPSDNQEVNIQFAGLEERDGSITVKVMDMLGRDVLVRSVRKGDGTTAGLTLIPGKDLGVGMYTVQAVYSGKTRACKLVIR